MKNNKGIEYNTTGNQQRVDMCQYHRKPSVLNHSHGAKFVDVKSISTRVLSTQTGYSSFFTVGFEIEKSTFGRGARKEYALIQGYERDGSCGVEAVTNILPLIQPSQWRNKVFDMIFKARKIMDDDTSPSNFRCGGHITIGVRGLSGENIRKKVRLNSAIFMALFRKRLKNNYCKHNLRMESEYGEETNHFNRWHYKYQFALVKDNCFEFRIPSRITSYKQMFRRYELMYHVLDFSIYKPTAQFSTLLRKVKPIILSMYEGDVEKTDNILLLAKDFRKFIKEGKISENIRDFIV